MVRFARFAWPAVVLAALLLPVTARAYCRLTTEMPEPGECATDGKPLYWPRQCLGYSVVPRKTEPPSLDALRDVVDDAFGVWAEVQCDGQPISIELQQTAATAECLEPEYNATGPNTNAVIFVDDWDERGLPGTAFGLTLVWHHPETGEIYDADLQINETLGKLAICEGTPPKCPFYAVDIQNVVTHEAGHYLGLGHTMDDLELNPTMAESAVRGETAKRSLAMDDVRGLCAIYGEYAPTSCEPADFRPNNGFSASCYFAEPNGGCGACGVPGARREGGPSALAALLGFAALAGLAIQRRWRRVAPSSSSPKPMNR